MIAPSTVENGVSVSGGGSELPFMAREVGEVAGVDVGVRAKLEPLRSKLVRLVDRGWLRKLPDGRFTTRL
ncbi:hypothetical protein ACFUJR_18090 [Streptomyces sp. NPDC057271]|uniref:hypothetical protein n=1 Tax=unclassified Streptomyces TaxID=2593676 RepID=UPI00362CD7D2